MNNIVLQSALNSITDRGIFIIVTSKKQKPLAKAYSEFSISLEFRTKKGVETVFTKSSVVNTTTFEYAEDSAWNALAIDFCTELVRLLESGKLRKDYGHIQ